MLRLCIVAVSGAIYRYVVAILAYYTITFTRYRAISALAGSLLGYPPVGSPHMGLLVGVVDLHYSTSAELLGGVALSGVVGTRCHFKQQLRR